MDGRAFPAFDALASDMGPLSTAYGRRLDGVLGYSFLRDRVVLIDYPRATLSVLPDSAAAEDLVRGVPQALKRAADHLPEVVCPRGVIHPH